MHNFSKILASFPPGAMPDSNMFSSDRMFESFSNAFHEAQALSFAGNLMDRDHEAIERVSINNFIYMFENIYHLKE